VSGLPCTKCGSRTAVIDTRTRRFHHRTQVYRRRTCLSKDCKHRFSSIELVAAKTGKHYGIARTYEVLDTIEKRRIINKVNQLFKEIRKVLDE
jgi:transcriptional regulator NrdR family protein